MPRVLLAIGLALCFGQIAAAQDTPEWQVYAGGSYGHGEISPAIPGLSSVNGWGYNVDVEQYVNRSIGGVVEFGDYYRRPTIDLAPFGFPGTREQVRTHFVDLLVGPQVRHNFGRVTPFGRAAVGFSRRIIDEQARFISSDKIAFAFGAGGGIDIRVHEHVAVRPIEGEFLLTHFAMQRQDNWSASAGVVFSWGQK